jgi:hypothetical protein
MTKRREEEDDAARGLCSFPISFVQESIVRRIV